MAALWNGSKCSHTTCMLRFFTDPRLALNSYLIFETGSIKYRIVDFSSIKYPVNLTFAGFGYKLTDKKVVNRMPENPG